TPLSSTHSTRLRGFKWPTVARAEKPISSEPSPSTTITFSPCGRSARPTARPSPPAGEREPGQDRDALFFPRDREHAAAGPIAGAIEEVREHELQGAARKVQDKLGVDRLDAVDDGLTTLFISSAHVAMYSYR